MNERDSSTCVRGINSFNAAIPWRLEHVISEVAGLANQVPQTSFRWIPKEANRTSHELAHWALINVYLVISILALALLILWMRLYKEASFVSSEVLVLLCVK